MLIRTLCRLVLASIPLAPAAARGPDDPDAAVPPARYSPVLSGSQSYRPVGPLPWGDVNRRVTPRPAPGQGKADPNTKPDKRGPHAQ